MSGAPGTPAARAVAGGLALALVGLGQFQLQLRPELRVWPLVMMLAGGLLFLAVALIKPEAWPGARWRLPARPLWIAAALALSGTAAALSFANFAANRTDYLPALLLWFGGMGAYLLAFLNPAWQPDWGQWRRRYGREALGVAAIMAAGAALRFYRLGGLPRVLNGDEGRLGQAALNTINNPLANPFALFENFGAFYLQGMALAMQAFGQNAFALRLLPAIGGTLAIGAVYLLARWLFGTRVAALSALLVAASHAHIHFSRTVAVGYIQGTLLIPLELYLFLSGMQKRSAARAALGGLLLGLHFNVYLSAQIIAAMLAVYLLIAAWLCRPLVQRAWRVALVFWGAVLTAALPAIAYAILTPREFLARLNAEGTFQSGWLQEQVAATGRSAALILAERVAHAFLSLNFYPAIDFYGTSLPLLDVVTGVGFVLGLLYALLRTRDPGYLLLNGFFWGATVAIGVFSIPPSADSYRMLIALPAALMMAALGLNQAIGVLAQEGRQPRVRALLTTGALAAILVLNTRAYFSDFVARCRYGGDPQTRFASYLGSFLSTANREANIYLLASEELRFGTHPSVEFLSRNLRGENVFDSVDSIPAEPNTLVIAIADRADELRAWARAHPGGSLERQYDCERLMLVAYEIPER